LGSIGECGKRGNRRVQGRAGEVWKAAYDEAVAEAIESGVFDPEEDDDGDYREAADETVRDWREGVDDYYENCF